MTFEVYQQKARETAQYPDIGGFGFLYPALGLAGEAGEVLEKIKKMFRDGDGKITYDVRMSIAKEISDVLWYVSNLAWEFGFGLNEIAQINLDKLSHRKAMGTIGGEGDER